MDQLNLLAQLEEEEKKKKQRKQSNSRSNSRSGKVASSHVSYVFPQQSFDPETFSNPFSAQ
jgi:hypothetical protein